MLVVFSNVLPSFKYACLIVYCYYVFIEYFILWSFDEWKISMNMLNDR